MPELSFLANDVAESAERGWGCIIFPGGAGRVPWLAEDVGAGVGFALDPDAGAAATKEFVDDGRDQPGPVVDNLVVSAVSFAVTSRECEGAVCRTGFSARAIFKKYITQD